MIQPLLQAHISKPRNVFRAKQYKVQQQNIHKSDALRTDTDAETDCRE